MPTVTVALICHDDDAALQEKLREIETWTRQPDEWLLLHTEGAKLTIPDGMRVISRPDKNDKGYDKRATALREAKSDYILFANYDDLHDPTCLEKLMAALGPVTKVVHCRTTGKHGHNNGTEFVPMNSGAENHIVHCETARLFGGYDTAIELQRKIYKNHQADKAFIGLVRMVLRPYEVTYVPETLITQR